MEKPVLTRPLLIVALALAMLVGLLRDAWHIWQTGSFTLLYTISYGISSAGMYLLLEPFTQPERS